MRAVAPRGPQSGGLVSAERSGPARPLFKEAFDFIGTVENTGNILESEETRPRRSVNVVERVGYVRCGVRLIK